MLPKRENNDMKWLGDASLSQFEKKADNVVQIRFRGHVDTNFKRSPRKEKSPEASAGLISKKVHLGWKKIFHTNKSFMLDSQRSHSEDKIKKQSPVARQQNQSEGKIKIRFTPGNHNKLHIWANHKSYKATPLDLTKTSFEKQRSTLQKIFSKSCEKHHNTSFEGSGHIKELFQRAYRREGDYRRYSQQRKNPQQNATQQSWKTSKMSEHFNMGASQQLTRRQKKQEQRSSQSWNKQAARNLLKIL